MIDRTARLALCAGLLLGWGVVCSAQQILYGGNEWLQFESAKTGWLVTVDPETGATTLIGRPAGVDDGVLFGASSVNNMASEVDDFFRIDPGTGNATFLGQTGNNPIGSLAFGHEGSGGPCGLDDQTPCPGGARSPVHRSTGEHPAAREVVRPLP